MFTFTIRDMRVSGQADAVVDAVKHTDRNAFVVVNLTTHEVQISPTIAGAAELSEAISGAGFDPVLSERECPRQGRAPAKIPFEGFAHDFGDGEKAIGC